MRRENTLESFNEEYSSLFRQGYDLTLMEVLQRLYMLDGVKNSFVNYLQESHHNFSVTPNNSYNLFVILSAILGFKIENQG